MTNVDRLTKLLTAYATSTLLVAQRLNSLERAMQADYTSSGLWNQYAKELGLAPSSTGRPPRKHESLIDQELSDAIAELQTLLKKPQKKQA
jgi:hypothetical protein